MYRARQNQLHDQRVAALAAMDPEERKAWFAGMDRIFARVDAVKAQDWRLYVQLGGACTPGIQELIDAQNWFEGLPISEAELGRLFD